MKSLPRIAGVVALGLLGYWLLKSFSLEGLIFEHSSKIESVEKRSQANEAALAEQGQLLGATRTEVGQHATQIEKLEKRVSETEAGLQKAAAEVEGLRASQAEGKASNDRLQAEIGALREEQARQAREVGELRKEHRRAGEELQRRLEVLEKRLSVPSPPTP